jgi:Nitrile hydratase beta subunit
MPQMREFHEGESVKIKEKNPIIPDPRRVPKYIIGRVGKVRRIHGYIHCPPDHEKRPPYHSCIFDLSQVSPNATPNDKVVLEVYEDLMQHEPLSSLGQRRNR